MSKEWSPDPKIIAKLEAEIKKPRNRNGRIALGSRILTWKDVLDEVKEGTKFGRQYYSACLKSSLGKQK